MKKLLIFAGLFCFSFALDAQTGIDEDMDKMREQMMQGMEEMMQMLGEGFDMAEGPIMKMDTMIFKNFGQLDENGEMIPNEEMQSFFDAMEKMMTEQLGGMDFGDMIPFEDDEPLIPGPDSMDEEKDGVPKKESAPVKKKKKRKSYSL